MENVNDMIVFCVVQCDLDILKGKVVDHTLLLFGWAFTRQLTYIWRKMGSAIVSKNYATFL